MGILVRWDDQAHTRILIEFETSWTWTDLDQALQQADHLIGSVPQSVDIIIDVEGSSLPGDFLNAAKNLLANPAPRANEGRRVVVGASSLIRTAYQTLQKTFSARLTGREVLFANDLAQARSMLYSMR
jgi:hypothetical protein